MTITKWTDIVTDGPSVTTKPVPFKPKPIIQWEGEEFWHEDTDNIPKDNGSPYDRGSADSYYRRSPVPHYYQEGTHKGERVTNLTSYDEKCYYKGYQDNEDAGCYKDYT